MEKVLQLCLVYAYETCCKTLKRGRRFFILSKKFTKWFKENIVLKCCIKCVFFNSNNITQGPTLSLQTNSWLPRFDVVTKMAPSHYEFVSFLINGNFEFFKDNMTCVFCFLQDIQSLTCDTGLYNCEIICKIPKIQYLHNQYFMEQKRIAWNIKCQLDVLDDNKFKMSLKWKKMDRKPQNFIK